MFDTIATDKCSPVRVRSRRHPAGPPPAQTLEEAYEARLLGEVARWDDQAAFESIYSRHVGAVTRAAMLICHDAGIAEDIAQHTFTALWVRADRLATKSLRLRPWLSTVARNAAIDYLRSGGLAPISLDHVAVSPAPEPGPEQWALAGESAAELYSALETLPPEQRTAVQMVYFAGMTYQAAADATGQSSGTIKSRVRLGIARLRARMATSSC